MKVISVSLFSKDGRGLPTKYAAQFLFHVNRASRQHLDALREWSIAVYHDGNLPPIFWLTLRFYFECIVPVYMGTSKGLSGTWWRFLVHDMPGVTMYYVMDVDSAFCKQDFEFLRVLEQGEYDGVVGTPSWGPHPCSPVQPVIDAGGFGLRRASFNFSMSDLIGAFLRKQASKDLTKYGCDELFLTECIAPLLTKHRIYTVGRICPIEPNAKDFYRFVRRIKIEDGACVDSRVAAVLTHFAKETGYTVTKTRSHRRKAGSRQRPMQYVLRHRHGSTSSSES